jgi:hypothetical protein
VSRGLRRWRRPWPGRPRGCAEQDVVAFLRKHSHAIVCRRGRDAAGQWIAGPAKGPVFKPVGKLDQIQAGGVIGLGRDGAVGAADGGAAEGFAGQEGLEGGADGQAADQARAAAKKGAAVHAGGERIVPCRGPPASAGVLCGELRCGPLIQFAADIDDRLAVALANHDFSLFVQLKRALPTSPNECCGEVEAAVPRPVTRDFPGLPGGFFLRTTLRTRRLASRSERT